MPANLLRSGLLLLAWLLALPALALDMPGKETRTALVIGNAAYANARLKTPVQDANALAASLGRLGFKVRLEENADQQDLVAAFRDFLGRAGDSDVRLIFFAGHGVQWRGRNYLIPVDLEIQREDDLSTRAIDLTDVAERLGQLRGGINILILDACRDSPFAGGIARLADARRSRMRGLASPGGPAEAGLAPLQAPSGTVVAFSTSPGALASDGDGQRHSIYARHLLEQIGRPGLPIEKMLKQVRIGVAHETKLTQIPWESSSLMGEFCFRPDPRGGCSGN
jgi:uncharacterized caspase-like protein